MQRKIADALGNTLSRLVPGVVILLQLAAAAGLFWFAFSGIGNNRFAQTLVHCVTYGLTHWLGWR